MRNTREHHGGVNEGKTELKSDSIVEFYQSSETYAGGGFGSPKNDDNNRGHQNDYFHTLNQPPTIVSPTNEQARVKSKSPFRHPPVLDAAGSASTSEINIP